MRSFYGSLQIPLFRRLLPHPRPSTHVQQQRLDRLLPSFSRCYLLVNVWNIPEPLVSKPQSPFLNRLLESLGGKGRKDEAGLVDLGVVIAAVLLLLLLGPGAEGNLDVAVGVLGADHEADLARGVGGDGGVGVLGHGEDLLAVLLELGDQGKVEPLVLSYKTIIVSQHGS